MTPLKRLFDLVLAVVLAVLLCIPLLVLMAILWATEGRPIFYVSERMKTSRDGFSLIKLRTMRPSSQNTGVTGGDKSDRIPPIYALLRKSRLDEIPQLWNVIRGDMSFVGPRPPLRVYVDTFPTLYAKVLRNRPGLTGLASLYFHKHEERLLAATSSAAETDQIYRRRCVPRKARLDLIYQKNQTLCFDFVLIWRTGKRLLRRQSG
ncbi:MAG: sugar transferase [Pseudomonadota bacterium]